MSYKYKYNKYRAKYNKLIGGQLNEYDCQYLPFCPLSFTKYKGNFKNWLSHLIQNRFSPMTFKNDLSSIEESILLAYNNVVSNRLSNLHHTIKRKDDFSTVKQELYKELTYIVDNVSEAMRHENPNIDPRKYIESLTNKLETNLDQAIYWEVEHRKNK